ncbi:major facilitator superfamily MFS_1 [Thalassoporum mexicanum PCC 7367]|uniref:MFS transporter n=1 Tax=Thalassoporum mexicanum TaxID=3457544 RepID=UPI00029FFAD8|nr:MFS transporter [Pseudanabaena sp. PCC 7367]AFY71458.1 major facilitator superfamily MFS_1 [Pseudanabaena sp. PCC 7367]
MKKLPRWLEGLNNPIFARLYTAQTINLIGDSLTWLGLALLAFQLAGDQSSVVLATALTIRVATFVILSPIAGALADRIDRKKLMATCHLIRMGIVCLYPLVTQVWQIYGIVLALNICYACFTPTFKATVSLVTTVAERPRAIALTSATSQLLGVLGPGLAGSIAALVGTRQIFFLDSITFLIAAILIMTLPGRVMVNQSETATRSLRQTWSDMRSGSVCLCLDPLIRYALALQLVAAIAGAQVLVNTVSHVQSSLQLGKVEYGWVMAAFGIGATIAAVGLGNVHRKVSPILFTSIGAILITLALLPAHLVDMPGLLLLWAIGGTGQTLVNVPTQNLIAERVAIELQGRVYGAHFAWSHLWWAIAYPLAGWLGSNFPANYFFYSSILGIALLLSIYLAFRPQQLTNIENGQWHEHEHSHDAHHQHEQAFSTTAPNIHSHLHFHYAQ